MLSVAVVVCLIATIVFLFGPKDKVSLFWRPETSRFHSKENSGQATSADLKELRSSVAENEAWVSGGSEASGIVEGAEKHIQFSAESRPKKTAVSVLYLHGFSATRQEIAPVPENIANKIHANYFATRLTGHGLTSVDLANSKPNDWIFDAIEAWHIAEELGERVIVIATSTGATLATWLAQQPEVKEKLAALVLVSPNYQPMHWSMPLFLWPWSRYWMPFVAGKEYGWKPNSKEGAKYWTYQYSTTLFHGMAALVKAVRKSPVEQILAPTLFIYSDHDQVVNPKFTDQVMRRWGSKLKHRISAARIEDDNNHVIMGDIVHPENTDLYTQEILTFLKSHSITK